MPSRTTPVIPGRRISCGLTTMSQVEVPTTVTNVPGCCTPAPGTETNESTLPTAIWTESGRPTRSATSSRNAPALVPSSANELPSFSTGSGKPG